MSHQLSNRYIITNWPGILCWDQAAGTAALHRLETKTEHFSALFHSVKSFNLIIPNHYW